MTPVAPLALNLAPELAGGLFGPAADVVGLAVAKAVQSATGTPDPIAAQQVLARDAEVASNLRLELARIAVTTAQSTRETDAEAIVSRLAAKGSAVVPAGALSNTTRARLPWAAPAISCVVLAIFGGAMLAALTRKLPAGSETVITMLLGTLAAMATSVVSYWVGSSAGSAAKTELMFGSQQSWAAAGPHAPAAKS